MSTRTRHLQIRVSPEEKAELERLAGDAGQDVSTYVRSCVLPDEAVQLRVLLERLRSNPEERSFVLAEVHDLLQRIPPGRFHDVVGHAPATELPPFEANYLAAMVEHVAHRIDVPPPAWAGEVSPLEQPYFAAPFPSLRGHLLREAPVAYKRRNLFVDAVVGDRV